MVVENVPPRTPKSSSNNNNMPRMTGKCRFFCFSLLPQPNAGQLCSVLTHPPTIRSHAYCSHPRGDRAHVPKDYEKRRFQKDSPYDVISFSLIYFHFLQVLFNVAETLPPLVVSLSLDAIVTSLHITAHAVIADLFYSDTWVIMPQSSSPRLLVHHLTLHSVSSPDSTCSPSMQPFLPLSLLAPLAPLSSEHVARALPLSYIGFRLIAHSPLPLPLRLPIILRGFCQFPSFSVRLSLTGNVTLPLDSYSFLASC